MKSPMDTPERYQKLSSNVNWKFSDDFRNLNASSIEDKVCQSLTAGVRLPCC